MIGLEVGHPRDRLRIHKVGKVSSPEDFTGLLTLSQQGKLDTVHNSLMPPILNMRRYWVRSYEDGMILRIRKVD